MKRRITEQKILAFGQYLADEERSFSTRQKYLRDLRKFQAYTNNEKLEKQKILDYKAELLKNYAVTGANSMLAALNAFLRFCGWGDLCVKQFKIQRQAYCSEEKELTKSEYLRLVETAGKKKNERLQLILQTICGSGIRVSELPFITVEAVRKGEANVHCKGKNRRIFIVSELKKKLLRYITEKKILTGPIFITKSGKPISRHNVWREMKSLCEQAKVLPSKVFPHNLRHLFARIFYGIEKDVIKLADILGHSNVNTTRIYIISTGNEHQRKLENMRLII